MEKFGRADTLELFSIDRKEVKGPTTVQGAEFMGTGVSDRIWVRKYTVYIHTVFTLIGLIHSM